MNEMKEIRFIMTRVLFLSPTRSFFFFHFIPSVRNPFAICLNLFNCRSLITALLITLVVLLWLAYMALETSGFSNMAIPDGRNLLGDLLHTPNTPQRDFLNENTSLLLDRTHMLSDSSPHVSDSLICAT